MTSGSAVAQVAPERRPAVEEPAGDDAGASVELDGGGSATGRSAAELVREGNRLLETGKPAEALARYREARTLAPESREVAFVEGLAHYDLKDFEAAREAFHRAEPFTDNGLADDALYSLGTCDHAEALEMLAQPQVDPKPALSLLESAMQRYREVLDRDPGHEAARDATVKAASMWKRLKEQLQRQQEQQPSNEPQEGSDTDQPDEQTGDPQKQKDEEQEADQRQSRRENQEEQKQQHSQAPSEESEADQQEGQDQEQAQDQSQNQQTAVQQQAAREEQVSREQAERKLREMMQAVRDRLKRRHQQVEPVPIRPVEKDW